LRSQCDQPEPLAGAAGLPGPNESNAKKLPLEYRSSLFEGPGLPPNRDGVVSDAEAPPNNDFEPFGEPNAFLGEPNPYLGDPKAFLGEPNAFDLGESNAVRGEPKAFL
jgi:hypothetical protein